MNEKQRKTVNNRIGLEKEKLLSELRKTPVVHVACKLAGVSKATFYRWKTEDAAFAVVADAALGDGKELISDMAISQLISAIKDKNMHAIRFWLSSHHPDYKTKVEIEGKIRVERELTPEEQELMMEALKRGRLSNPNHDADGT